ncbi:ATP-binding protein [uncultured Methanolobus sp.]|uniref:ATP-binding protein n=1 Tax=uncultured Methanolobus sp. TaxID=218300 RepID=UPI002AAB126D|nr:ATP-binding protein [uncultured Methanolobus sp.]
MPGKSMDSKSLRRFCLTGVRGVGKSTVLGQVKEKVKNLHFVTGSDILQNMMGEEYSNFEYLPEDEKYALRIKLNKVLDDFQQETKMDLVVDAHLTVYNLKTKSIDMIFTQKDIDFYTDLILLDSNPEKVYHHRMRDTKKKRIVDLETIKMEMETERREAIRISSEYKMNLHIVQMDEEIVEKIIRILMDCKFVY